MQTYKIIDATSTTNITYIWIAELNTNTSEPKWKIKVIDETWDEIVEKFPIWPDWYQRYNYEFIWDNRTNYTYK